MFKKIIFLSIFFLSILGINIVNASDTNKDIASSIFDYSATGNTEFISKFNSIKNSCDHDIYEILKYQTNAFYNYEGKVTNGTLIDKLDSCYKSQYSFINKDKQNLINFETFYKEKLNKGLLKTVFGKSLKDTMNNLYNREILKKSFEDYKYSSIKIFYLSQKTFNKTIKEKYSASNYINSYNTFYSEINFLIDDKKKFDSFVLKDLYKVDIFPYYVIFLDIDGNILKNTKVNISFSDSIKIHFRQEGFMNRLNSGKIGFEYDNEKKIKDNIKNKTLFKNNYLNVITPYLKKSYYLNNDGEKVYLKISLDKSFDLFLSAMN